MSTHLFWNQIWTDLSVMLISSAILSRTAAVGVGFLLNSISRVTNWSCVARWRLLFFCCWVNVLLRCRRPPEVVVEEAEVELEVIVREDVVGLVVAEEGVEIEEDVEEVADGATGVEKVSVEDMAVDKEIRER